MLDLFREARRDRDRFPDLTADRVFRAASRYLDSGDLHRFRTYVESGATIDAPHEAFWPCIARDLVEMPSFELGMSRTDLVEKHTVAGLKPGSEAERAGLRDGDTVTGTSVYWNDTSSS
jgi:predicted metalloprotease with PDZ domain